ncbi:MAG: VanW family protein, partial [Actinobacteria bacterium]|nr:VanW family protein [Actinomycetota bacterium]
MSAESHAIRVRRRRKPAARQLVLRWTLLVALLLTVLGGVLGLAFAGSSNQIATGVKIGGVDVGGLTAEQARTLLEQRSAKLEHVPVVFVSGSHRFEITPARLGVKVDWSAAVAAAEDRGGGFGPLRGLRRLEMRLFGADVAPPVKAWDTAVDYELTLIGREVNRPHRDAAVKLRGLKAVVVAGQDGRVLDREAVADVLVSTLGSLERGAAVTLPVKTDPQTVVSDDLTEAADQVRTALSAPVRLTLGPTKWRLARWKIAPLLDLPDKGATTLGLGGPGERRWISRVAGAVDREPFDATWSVTNGGITILPARDGILLERAETEMAVLAALLSPTDRVAKISATTLAPSRTTEQARSMGISGVVGSYETIYGGDANRINNVQLVAHLIDGTLIGPGDTFSFNDTTGERTAEKGFKEAPVIINGELGTGVAGGVCQVSTTVFNAAFEGGLAITERTNHALYISHYPLGRDATVNYPDIDLEFVNDTSHWLLLRTFVGSSSLVVNLYGTPVDRRVETETAPLTVSGPVPIQRVDDPNLLQGQSVVEESGLPPQQTSVQRLVYSATGTLLHDDTWTSYYQG